MFRGPYAIPIISQYLLLVVIAVISLTSPPAPDAWQWWITAGLLAALGILYYRWPSRRYQLYLAMEFTLLAALTAMDGNAVFLGFAFAAHAAILYPNRRGALWIAILVLVSAPLLIYHQGWLTGTLLALLVSAGWASFGYANYAQVRAQAAHRESQALLTELQSAHRQLQDYAEQVQTLTLVEERNRLARELHDSAKQQAFAATAQLATARSLLKPDPDKAEAHLLEAERLIHEVSRELTDLIHELHPAVLEGKGLVAALRDHVENWSQRNGVEANLRVTGERTLSVDVEQALLRTAQESLANVARHSQADHVEIMLGYDTETITLTVSDDGRGFDPCTSVDGIGLRSMRERAERLNGTLRIESAPGRGTRVTATYPIHTP